MSGHGRPGSAGEHDLQEKLGTVKRANAFYDNQVLDHLTPLMREFMERMTMCFISTSDAHGECDSSFRAGPPGFVRVIDEKTVMWPEYKGNGVMASMGNINENGYVGLLFVDFFETQVGLHVNGKATVIENAAVEAFAGCSTGSRSPRGSRRATTPRRRPSAGSWSRSTRPTSTAPSTSRRCSTSPRARTAAAARVTSSRPRTPTARGCSRRARSSCRKRSR